MKVNDCKCGSDNIDVHSVTNKDLDTVKEMACYVECNLCHQRSKRFTGSYLIEDKNIEKAIKWWNAENRIPTPLWTVLTNIVSQESNQWIGTCWEFFEEESDANSCYARHEVSGNSPTKRPFVETTDRQHVGVVHGGR